jgi:hypothetical protein
MAKNRITKATAAAVIYPMNHRECFDDVTIQNNTDAAISVKITAMNVQTESPIVYSNPAEGALSVAAGAIGVLRQPATAMEISGTGTGVVHIVEPY